MTPKQEHPSEGAGQPSTTDRKHLIREETRRGACYRGRRALQALGRLGSPKGLCGLSALGSPQGLLGAVMVCFFVIAAWLHSITFPVFILVNFTGKQRHRQCARQYFACVRCLQMVKREEQTTQHTCRSCNKKNPSKRTLSEQKTLHANLSHAASVSRWLHMLSNHCVTPPNKQPPTAHLNPTPNRWAELKGGGRTYREAKFREDALLENIFGDPPKAVAEPGAHKR